MSATVLVETFQLYSGLRGQSLTAASLTSLHHSVVGHHLEDRRRQPAAIRVQIVDRDDRHSASGRANEMQTIRARIEVIIISTVPFAG
ncbi:hypothetical protein [Bradyrhizobium sp.]|uniref:hypothetical protein n=1 Tax=Bradyrhizobium sp. TaxID=376 RepID=UPI003C3C4439